MEISRFGSTYDTCDIMLKDQECELFEFTWRPDIVRLRVKRKENGELEIINAWVDEMKVPPLNFISENDMLAKVSYSGPLTNAVEELADQYFSEV